MHLAYRDLLVQTYGMQRSISGVIMFEETLARQTSHGETFPAFLERIGVVPGVKVDRGLTPLRPGSPETITEGLDGLAKRLAEYREPGRPLRQMAGGRAYRGGLSPDAIRP